LINEKKKDDYFFVLTLINMHLTVLVDGLPPKDALA